MQLLKRPKQSQPANTPQGQAATSSPLGPGAWGPGRVQSGLKARFPLQLLRKAKKRSRCPELVDKKGNRPQPTGEYRRGSLHGTVSRGIRRSRGLGPGGQGPEAKAAAAVADRAPRLRFRVSVTVRNCDRGTGDPDERPPHTGSAGMRPRLSPHPRATPRWRY